jgi:SAM-dependent methyltransferase
MDQVLDILRAAGEPSRLRILAILDHGELTIGELTYVLRQSQPRVSRHVRLLADAGLLHRYPEGSWVFCRLERRGEVGTLLSQILQHVAGGAGVMQADLARLNDIRQERQSRASQYFTDNASNWSDVQALYVPETEIETRMVEHFPALAVECLLDLGTGTGRMLECFGARAEEAIGFDLNTQMLALARARISEAGLVNCQVRQGDIAALSVPSASADLVILHQVMHFLDNPELVMREAGRVLRTGGRLLIADFASHSKEWLRDEHAHRRLGFSNDEIAEWLELNDLALLHTEHMVNKSVRDGLEVVLWVAEKHRAV